jgi:prolyl oligopeptidase
VPAVPQPSGASTSVPAFDYPEAERLDLIDEIHGTAVADAYRWLEDPEDPRTIAWTGRQDALYADWLERRLGFGAHDADADADGADVDDEGGSPRPVSPELPRLAARLCGRLAELADAGSVSVPVWRGGRYFLTRRGPSQEHPVLYVVDAHDARGTDRALIDPAALDPSGTTTLDGWFPSADGALLAYFLSAGGTERPLLRIMEVATGADVEGPIDGVGSRALAWFPDSTGFYYQRRPTPEQVAEGVSPVHRLVYLHRIGTPYAHDVLVSGPERGLLASRWYAPIVSPDGRWLCIEADRGLSNDVYLADLTASDPAKPEFTVVQVEVEARTDVVFGRDGRVYARTLRDAPNGRLCVIDPERPEYEHWHALLPEDPEAVLKDFAILDGDGMERPRLLALRSRHALSELVLYDLETGEPSPDADVHLPGLGTVQDVAGHPDGGSYAYVTYTDFRNPPRVYRLDARTGAVKQWPQVTGTDPLSESAASIGAAVHVDQVTYSSADGTEVRMFILSPTGRPDRPRPTILYGYGAHGHSSTPAFNPLRVAWVEAGGVYAIANIRGGGEEGEAWHRARMRENKRNTFADFHAVGDHLVHQGWTTGERLGVHGGSAGGRLVGMALTERPEAYAAVLCSAPQLDMIRAELAGAAALWTGEVGTVRDPEQFGWLIAQSPYHLVRAGTAYPAILLTVFEGDARVATWHARKFAAAIQHATSAARTERPILLRREADVGHVTRSASSSVAWWSEQLGFFAAQLGLTADDARS